MPIYTDPTDSISAVITNRGREILAKSVLGMVSFRLSGFEVGRGGYDTSNPVKVDLVDPATTTLTSSVFPIPPPSIPSLPPNPPAPFSGVETPFPNVIAPICRLSQADATYGLGELGVWAEILSSTDLTLTVGSQWLFALAHFPLLSKTNSHVFVFRVVIAL